MGASPKARARYFSGSGKGLSKGTRETDSRRSPRTVLASPANTPSPSPSIGPDTEAASKVTQSTAATGSEDIAPEIVVWTGHMNNMMGDSSESATSTTPATPASEEKTVIPAPTSQTSPLAVTPSIPEQNGAHLKESSSLSSLSSLSDQFDFSSHAPSGSSKATTPVDHDVPREAPAPSVACPNQPTSTPRRKWDVRPKVSIPSDLPLSEYAMQCVAAAEASRLNPYALHQEEYLMLRDHISHTQVTTYLNIRNGILRLWVRNPQIPVTREEAVGCAKDPRWFDVASICFDWLVRRGYINFGCVEIRPP
ncbi:hypothetical protein VTH82DRAFT_3576, partial [Thermothelomyces myriococcoides]